MSRLSSPKKISKFIGVIIFTSLVLFILLPNSYNQLVRIDKVVDNKRRSKQDVNALNQVDTVQPSNYLNTTWDDDNPWVKKDSIYSASAHFLERLSSFSVEGHTADQINTLLPSSTIHSNENITVIIPIYSKEPLSKIDTIKSWSLENAELTIHIFCSSQYKATLYDKLGLDENDDDDSSNGIKITVLDRSVSTTTAVSSTGIYSRSTAGAAIWLQALIQHDDTIDTEYVYILDEGLPLSTNTVHELSYLLKAKQGTLRDSSSEDTIYKNALVGTRAYTLYPPSERKQPGEPDQDDSVIENFCLPVNTKLPINVSQATDMLLGGWLLSKDWLPSLRLSADASTETLNLPLGYYLSRTLKQQLNIPTIYLPFDPLISQQQQQPSFTAENKQVCKHAQAMWTHNDGWRNLVKKNRYPTALQYRFLPSKRGVLIVAQGSKQFISLFPLLCRFTKDDYPVHLAVLGNDVDGEAIKNTLAETECPALPHIRVHDFTDMKEHHEDIHLEYLLKIIQPRIMFQVKPVTTSSATTPTYYALQTMAEAHQITVIGLPEKEIEHALWIPDLSLEALSNWNKIEIKMVVITDRRPHSLSRLLQSSAKSIYLGDSVDLMIHMEQSADRVTRMLVNSFQWQHGQKILRHRIRKGGLMPAIVESWYPSHNDEYAVLLEDDIEVSPLFYVWSKYSILKYRYSGHNEAHRLMYGISLYAPRNLELIPAGRVTFDPNSVLLPAGYPEHIPYASQVPCSWGGVYFPEHWREFHSYLVRRLEDLSLPKDHQVRLISVPGSRSDKWKKSWKKYFIELVYLRGYVMLYPNFEGFEAFSTNHVEFGTHVKSEKRQSVIGTFMVPLMQRDTILSQLPAHSLPYFDDLPVLDLWGQLQTLDRLEEVGSQYHQHVSTCPRTFGTFDHQEFFCVVDGAPDPPQEFPSSPKKPKPPVLVKDTVQPIQYNYITEYTEEEEEKGQDALLEYGPRPIDVAQLPAVDERVSNKDDERLDLEHDLDTLNRLYLKLHPQKLEFLEDERIDYEEEDQDEDSLLEDEELLIEKL